MKNMFCVTSYNSVGCSFIDWSVYFLTGQTQHYNVKLKSWLPVLPNPVTPLNAHGHKKNHPFGYAETQQYIDHIKSLNDNILHSIYPTAILFGMAAEYLNLPADSIRNHDDFNSITQFKKNDFDKVLKLCEHQQIKTVYVASDPATILYFDKKRTVSALLLNYNTRADSIQHVKEDFHETFFNQSLMLTMKTFQRWHLGFRLLLAALLTAAIGSMIPQALGAETGAIHYAVSAPNELLLLFAIFVGKILLTVVALGLGVPGGIVGPVFGIGIVMGTILAFVPSLFSGDHSAVGTYALLGMAGMMAATLHAPLAALVAVMELASNPRAHEPIRSMSCRAG